MSTPIIITSHRNKIPCCPKCNKPENIKLVCDHCGYEYKDSTIQEWLAVLYFILIVLFVSWIIVTIIIWIINYNEVTLVQTFLNQFKFIYKLLHHIY